MSTARQQNGNANQAATHRHQAETPILDEMLARVTYKPFMSDREISLDVKQVLEFLCRPTKSGATCPEWQVVRFLKLCEARGLNPWEGDAYLVGYDSNNGPEFSLITSHQSMLKRAEASQHFDGMQCGVIIQRGGEIIESEGDIVLRGEELVGGWAKVFRKDQKIPTYRRVSLATFNKGFGRWKIDAAGMIVKVAEADALRSAFPNTLSGMYISEEIKTEETRKPSDYPKPMTVAETAKLVDEKPKAEPPTPEQLERQDAIDRLDKAKKSAWRKKVINAESWTQALADFGATSVDELTVHQIHEFAGSIENAMQAETVPA